MNRKLLLIGAVLAAAIAIALGIGAYFLFFSGAPSGQAVSAASNYTDAAPLEYRSENANVYGAMLGAGLNDSFVDIDESHAYLAYDLPSNYSSDIMQRYCIGLAAASAPQTTTIVVAQYRGGIPATVWTVATADFQAYERGEITSDQLDAKIEKQSLS
ncbi:MAG: hypothetical protein KGH63_03510 [Candidatus Micrarchaeota archaeon]|nr:hypothetical protein [Candidatus Micrarchaeota archaeon]